MNRELRVSLDLSAQPSAITSPATAVYPQLISATGNENTYCVLARRGTEASAIRGPETTPRRGREVGLQLSNRHGLDDPMPEGGHGVHPGWMNVAHGREHSLVPATKHQGGKPWGGGPGRGERITYSETTM